ncbi:hypothetical protein [Dyadobacter sp. NIV53]|nr:hypothetical protein [Dyadobacter sp. NIV53]
MQGVSGFICKTQINDKFHFIMKEILFLTAKAGILHSIYGAEQLY